MFHPWDSYRPEWKLLPSAKLPDKMENMAMVSIYNNLYLTGMKIVLGLGPFK